MYTNEKQIPKARTIPKGPLPRITALEKTGSKKADRIDGRSNKLMKQMTNAKNQMCVNTFETLFT